MTLPAAQPLSIGNIQVTPLSDGHFPVAEAALPALFAAYEPETASHLRRAASVPDGAIPMAVNAYLVRMGERTILVDAGAAGALGPTLGDVPRALAALGLSPARVDTIILTHAHRDHAAGLLDPSGNALYPHAELVAAAAEVAYWSDDAALAGASPTVRNYFEPARRAFAAYAERLRLIGAGEDVAPGAATVPLPGHTPGHMGVRLHAGKEQLLIWGDLVHLPAFQLARPDWSIAFDSDPGLAAETRRRAFDMVASDRLLVAGMHLDFPGFGHLTRRGEDFGFEPLRGRHADVPS